MKWTARFARLGRLLPARDRIVGGAAQGLMSATAAVLAYLPTRPLGLQEGFWASITAIAVVQSQLSDTRNSARDQFAGAAVGGVVGAAAVTGFGQHLAVYALAIVASMAICWILNVASAARLSGSTVTIILMVPHKGPVEWMMISRIAEVGWGVVVAIVTVWVVNRIKSPAAKQPPTAV